ncbi:MAG TPA: response regulator [Spirochaetota bacterium]|nr:response regulator [Spirochaetota bacterium]
MNEPGILIVEDEMIVALDIQSSLERIGYRNVRVASDGAQALETVGEEAPDLILMDILLKGSDADATDGVSIAMMVKERRDIPIIYITAHADDATLQRAKLTQPYGYILKPFNERELRTTIEMALYKHRMETELRRSEERYRRFFEEDLTGDFITDGNGTIVTCNPAFARIFGFSSTDETIGTGFPLLFPSVTDWEGFIRSIRENRMLVYHERELCRTDGSPVYIVANATGIFDGGDLVEIRGYIFDETHRKRLEQQFLQAQKMEAVGRLAGGIAHDFNNLLTVINGYSEFILSQVPAGNPFIREIEEINRAGERAAHLTRQLLAFSRKQVMRPRVVDLNTIVTNIESMLRRLIGEHIELKSRLGEDLWKIEVDPGQIEQVIMNLTVNARDAMPGGGNLLIETANCAVPFAPPGCPPEMRQGDYVRLAISDTGHGFDNETRSHIFEPFFTTKAPGEGTGLGLPTVYGIIAQSDGHIDVHSEPGKGSVFTIFLPRAEKEKTEPAKTLRTTAGEARGGTETVLVVEDEDVVRSLICHVLQLHGYTVLAARNGTDALSIHEHHGGNIELAVVDLVMPGLSGTALAERLRQAVPHIKVLFISGYTDQTIHDLIADEKNAAFLQKPFRPDELASKLREMLDR